MPKKPFSKLSKVGLNPLLAQVIREPHYANGNMLCWFDILLYWNKLSGTVAIMVMHPMKKKLVLPSGGKIDEEITKAYMDWLVETAILGVKDDA